MGGNCPRSDPDFTHRGYYLDPNYTNSIQEVIPFLGSLQFPHVKSPLVNLQIWTPPLFFWNVSVVANHKNDTCFGNGLVMGFSHCQNCGGLVKTLKKVVIYHPHNEFLGEVIHIICRII